MLTGVRGGLLVVGSLASPMLASLGRRLYAPGARGAVSLSLSLDSETLPRREGRAGAKRVLGDMRRGSRAFPWKGPAVVEMESVLPLRGMEVLMLGLRECVVLGAREGSREGARERALRDALLLRECAM